VEFDDVRTHHEALTVNKIYQIYSLNRLIWVGVWQSSNSWCVNNATIEGEGEA